MDTEDLAKLNVDHPAVGLAKMKQEAKRREERAESEVVACPECGTEVLKDDLEDALDTAETHDDKRHDGERTAMVNGMLPPSDDLAEAAQKTVEKLRNAKPGNGGLGETNE